MATGTAKKSVEERLAYIEDYIEIIQTLSAYGPAADATHWDFLKTILSDDCVFKTATLGTFEGHDGLKRMFDADFHLKYLVEAGSGHVSTTPHVVIEGDQAVATNHFMLFRHDGGDFPVIKLVAMRWFLARSDTGWKITFRDQGLLDGSDHAVDLFKLVDRGPAEFPAGVVNA